MSTTLIVTGFHRSGTSMVTQLLHDAGLFVGDDLLGAMPSNPYGHYEDREVIALHDALLRDNGHNWQIGVPLSPEIGPTRWRAAARLVTERQIAHDTWGFKDPRACMFLPMWKHLLPAAKLLVVFRSAIDSVTSLERRHSAEYFAKVGPAENHLRFWTEPDLALRMWIEHNDAVLRVCAGYPDDVVAVSFQTVAAGFPIVDLLIDRWGLPLRSLPTHEVFDASATSSRSYPLTVSDPSLVERALDTWRRLCDLERRTLFGEEVADAA